MPENEFEIEQIGEVYAGALLNLAQKENKVDAITDDVRGIGQLLNSNVSFKAFVGAVLISAEEQISKLEKIFRGRIEAITLEALKSMARRERLMFLSGFVAAWEELLKKRAGRVDVEVTSSTELAGDTLGRVRDAIGRATGQTADVAVKVDPSIIGGIKVRVGDTLIDASVETQLARIHEQLKKGGIAKIQKNMQSVVG